jgi:hypothetical protein
MGKIYAPKLLSRDEFREGVLKRARGACEVCGADGKLDAHHIMERRLWPDGGYYLDNGAALCQGEGGCHMRAEQTVLSCEEIRMEAGIEHTLLPPHLYPDERYDKWGNPYLPNGQRVRGELFYDESVQKVLAPVLHEFTKYIKYPRTYHFPWSPGISKDDRVLAPDARILTSRVVVTEKMDGENTTMYSDYIHARSVAGGNHVSRSWVKQLWSQIKYNIPENWRVCGENLFAKHSIGYTDLPSYFELFSVWNDRNVCLSWDETVEWAELLDVQRVPVLYRGEYDETLLRDLAEFVVKEGGEGIVVRMEGEFNYSDFRNSVAKYVRQNHVQTHGGWMRKMMTPNGLKP